MSGQWQNRMGQSSFSDDRGADRGRDYVVPAPLNVREVRIRHENYCDRVGGVWLPGAVMGCSAKPNSSTTDVTSSAAPQPNTTDIVSVDHEAGTFVASCSTGPHYRKDRCEVWPQVPQPRQERCGLLVSARFAG